MLSPSAHPTSAPFGPTVLQARIESKSRQETQTSESRSQQTMISEKAHYLQRVAVDILLQEPVQDLHTAARRGAVERCVPSIRAALGDHPLPAFQHQLLACFELPASHVRAKLVHTWREAHSGTIRSLVFL
eukprot:m.94149 g.94149  ORF g.94149 m.94149 type:complete len:131 (-) comp51225_c0_seq14:23-415(-)